LNALMMAADEDVCEFFGHHAVSRRLARDGKEA
jgi:hypothetical protein